MAQPSAAAEPCGFVSRKYRLPDTTTIAKPAQARVPVLLDRLFSAAQVFLRLRKRHGRLSRWKKRRRSTRVVIGRAALHSINFLMR